MPTIAEVRKQYPQYSDMSDRQLADALHAKYYSDIPRADFDAKVGIKGPRVDPADMKALSVKPKATAKDTGWDVANSLVGGTGEAVRGMAQTAIEGALPFAPKGVLSTAANYLARADYKPQTEAGKVARTAGQMSPALAAPGSAGQRVANFLVPTATTEIAGRTAEAMGANETGVNIARTVGGIAGGVAANVRPPARQPAAPKVKAPTVEQLRTDRTAAYDAVRSEGIQYRPEATTRFVETVQSKLADDLDPDLHKGLTAIVNRRINSLIGKDGAAEPITLDKLDKVRQVVNEEILASNASKGEKRLAYKVRETIDAFIAEAGDGDVMTNGDPRRAAETLKRARELHTRVAKIEALEEAKVKARNATGPSGSGGNINNNLRREVGKAADRGRNWTPAEAEALDKVRMGGKGQNALRQVGKLSPSGNGLTQGLSLAAAAQTGGASIPVSLAGMVSKYVADGMTKRAVENVIRLVASGQDAQVARMAVANPKVGALVRELRGSSTINALSGGGSGPEWQAKWQSPPKGRAAP